MITAGESITIDFNLTEADLSYYDNRGLLVFEPGAFSVFVGGSSQTALEQKVEVE